MGIYHGDTEARSESNEKFHFPADFFAFIVRRFSPCLSASVVKKT